jgi:glucokinase
MEAKGVKLKETVILCIDIGGTMVRVGALDQQGTLLSVSETRFESRSGPEAGFKAITQLSKAILDECGRKRLLGIGLGVTGPVDHLRGTINNPFTLPTWDNVPIVDWFAKWSGTPVVLENDADMAALGEYWLGAGQNIQRLYVVTVGTGIGTAFILKGEIYRGINGAHPEGGHQIIDPEGPDCYCGAKGCWESLASGSAITSQAQSMLVESPSSILMSLSGGKINTVDARMVTDAARQGDQLAVEVVQRAAHYLSLGLINTLMMFAPDMVVLTGGVIKSLDLFLPTIIQAVQLHNVMVPTTQIIITPASLGYYAGLYGCAYAVLRQANT